MSMVSHAGGHSSCGNIFSIRSSVRHDVALWSEGASAIWIYCTVPGASAMDRDDHEWDLELCNLGSSLLDGRLHFRFFTVPADIFEFDPLFLGGEDDGRAERNQFIDTQRSVADLRVVHMDIGRTPHPIYANSHSQKRMHTSSHWPAGHQDRIQGASESSTLTPDVRA